MRRRCADASFGLLHHDCEDEGGGDGELGGFGKNIGFDGRGLGRGVVGAPVVVRAGGVD